MELITIITILYYLFIVSIISFIGVRKFNLKESLQPFIPPSCELCILIRIFSEPYSHMTRTDKETVYYDPASDKHIQFPSIDDKWNIHLSVVIPAYEEQDRLPLMLDECLGFLESRQMKNNSFQYEVIIVSDGSKDKTPDVALKYVKKYNSEKIRLLELETNRGKGGAVYMGVQNARGAVILFADADGATKFDDIVKVESALELLLKKNYHNDPEAVANLKAIICGSRAHLEKEASAKRSFFRTILMHGFHFLVWLFAVRTIRDTQCGFKLLTRKAAKLCFSSLHIRRWAFDVELLYIAEKLKIPISEVAVRWTEIDGSKLVPFWSWLQMGRDLFLIWLRYRIGAWKLYPHEDS